MDAVAAGTESRSLTVIAGAACLRAVIAILMFADAGFRSRSHPF